MAVLGIGCTKAYTIPTRFTPTGLAPEDAIAVIQVGSGEQEYSDKLERKVVECIEDVLEDTHPTVRIVPPEEFRRVVFPDLTPAEILSGDEWWEWEQLTKDQSLKTRIARLGLRYLIIVSGGTTTITRAELEAGWVAPLEAGGSGGVVAPTVKYDRQCMLQARIIDVKQGREAGIVRAIASGETTWIWPPLPLIINPTFPEARACSDLGEEVAKVLEGTLPAVTEE